MKKFVVAIVIMCACVGTVFAGPRCYRHHCGGNRTLRNVTGWVNFGFNTANQLADLKSRNIDLQYQQAVANANIRIMNSQASIAEDNAYAHRAETIVYVNQLNNSQRVYVAQPHTAVPEPPEYMVRVVNANPRLRLAYLNGGWQYISVDGGAVSAAPQWSPR